MFLKRLWALALLSLLTGPIATAFAQGTAGTGSTATPGTFSAIITKIGGNTVSSLAQAYLGVKDCTTDVAIEFQLNGITAGKENVDVWIGDNSCNSTGRTNTTIAGGCRWVNTFPTESRVDKFMINLKAKDVVQDGKCDALTESMPKIWFLAVSNAGPTSTEDATASYAVYNQLNVDLLPPQPPTSVKGGRGGSEIPVSWKTSDTHLHGFVVYVDSSGMTGSNQTSDAAIADEDASTATTANTGGSSPDASTADGGSRVNVSSGSSSSDCGPTLLVAGQPGDGLPVLDELKRKSIGDRNATSTTIVPGDLSGKGEASAAVASVDLAGNESALSNVVCIQVVETNGFFDDYRKLGGDAATGCPCSAMGPVQVQNALPVALSLLALFRSRRKRYS